MALIKCTECGNEISERAIFCPKCGCPMCEIQKDMQNKKISLLIENPESINNEHKGTKYTFKKEKRLKYE